MLGGFSLSLVPAFYNHVVVSRNGRTNPSCINFPLDHSALTKLRWFRQDILRGADAISEQTLRSRSIEVGFGARMMVPFVVLCRVES